jgi:Mg-chelatase subunit ChlD
MRIPLLLFLLIPTVCTSQGITAGQQKALNNYVAYANQSADEVIVVVKSIIDYYPKIARKNVLIRYTCPTQPEVYYLNQAVKESATLGSLATVLNTSLNGLHGVAIQIDEKCKALETYHKLEDYKQDNFAKAELLIAELQRLIVVYRLQQTELTTILGSTYKKLSKLSATNQYNKTDLQMVRQIEHEREFINSWTFNLKEELHTGWPVDKLEQDISETDAQLRTFESNSPILKYPASSMYGSFKESLAAIIKIKRSGLDGYNFEAKKSDRHSNTTYLDLINYFNGALVADHNTFVEFSERDGYFGLKSIKYIPAFEIRSTVELAAVDVRPFQSIDYVPLQVSVQKIPISKTTFVALTNYVDFINETLRQVDYLQRLVNNLNSSTPYYRDITSFKGKGGLSYTYSNFELPLSRYQTTIAESKGIPSDYVKSLNDQTQVLLNILKEMDQLSALLETETKEKRYENDNLKKIDETIARNAVLVQIIDDKKERLYDDVRRIYNSYPVANPSNSWYVSGKALQMLADYDHEALFKAKLFYGGETGTIVSTVKIDQAVREVIANEYANMKGIEKIGRSNGLCPYTPYEDLPVTSKLLSEKLVALKLPTASGHRHPYHDMVYHYNDIVNYLNKFSELSKDVMILKTIRQPELFDNGRVDRVKGTSPNSPNQAVVNSPVVIPTEGKTKSATSNPLEIVHDTIYIERRDTVYLGSAVERARSMEGYASNNMVLLLDVSGSMNAEEKLPLLKTSVLNLMKMMRTEDKVSIVVYSGKAKVLLPPTSFKEEEKIKKVINQLKSEGKTDGNAGLKLAYEVADENYIRGGNNRIILATDGEFPISDETFTRVDLFSKQDIFISVFNFGRTTASSTNLLKLAVAGKGNYEYINKQNAELKLINEAKSKRNK